MGTLSRPTVVTSTPTTSTPTTSTSTNIPTIRLITATPSASGNSFTASPASSFATKPPIDSSWPSIPNVLLPKHESSPKKRLVLKKKSKLSLLGAAGREKDKDKGKDLSDVVRRVGVPSASDSTRGFEIYVDPMDDPEIGEIVIVKKKKSRTALESVRWGPTSLGEVTNMNSNTSALPTNKVKGEEKGEGKWWTIGRGRKDSKEKEKEKAAKSTLSATVRAKSPEPTTTATAPPPRGPPPRSKTPEPLNLSKEAQRTRFNSLDPGIFLSTPITTAPPPIPAFHLPSVPSISSSALQQYQTHPHPHQHSMDPSTSQPPLHSRAGTPTLLVLPPDVDSNSNSGGKQGAGSIAVRAMRSVRSLARIGSWAHLKNEEGAGAGAGGVHKVKEKAAKEKEGKTKEKEGKKKKKVKEKVKKENVENADEGTAKKSRSKSKSKSKTKEKTEKEKKDKDKDKEQDKLRNVSDTIRLSSSSFEIGMPSPMPPRNHDTQTLGKKKRSILGLGLPSSMSMTMRLPSVRSASGASSIRNVHTVFNQHAGAAGSKLSVESGGLLLSGEGRDRVGSSSTTASSLRPMSVTSSVSGVGSRLSSGSGGSVRWDEEKLESVMAVKRRERMEREREREREREKGKDEGGGRNSKSGKEKERERRHSVEGRRRTPLSEVFPPDANVPGDVRAESPADSVCRYPPILSVESATSDGHSVGDDDSLVMEAGRLEGGTMSTPVKRTRTRPLSEQLLSKTRPRGIYESEDGVISILDAATNDLAQLINNLDLEATPGTPDMTPLKPFPRARREGGTAEVEESPSKKKNTKNRRPFHGVPSVSSLRPYAQSRRNAPAGNQLGSTEMIGMQIAPWRTLLQDLSPMKGSPARATGETSPVQAPPTVRPTHKRTMTPGPEPEPAPVFQPLRPARSRLTLKVSLSSLFSTDREGTVRAPASLTSGTAVTSSKGSTDELFSSPMFKRARQRFGTGDRVSNDSENNTVPIPSEARRVLGMAGTMGGSDVSAYEVQELDASDPDSDIPDELQFILAGRLSDDGDTLSYREPPSSPLLEALSKDGPPPVELPVFRAQLVEEDDNHVDADGMSEEEADADADTKKSFDFTGEIKKLYESGASDRRSFVEQLENAFRTPAKVDFRYGFELGVDVPPMPPMPKLPLPMPAPALRTNSSQEESKMKSFETAQSIMDMNEPTLLHFNMTMASAGVEENGSGSGSKSEFYSGSQVIDSKEPTLPGSDSLISSDGAEMILDVDDSLSRSLATSSSSRHRPSDGQLNKAFKFGGRPKTSPPPLPTVVNQQDKPQTLSDIIPPPSHARSLSGSSIMDEDDSVLNSILAKVSDIPPLRPRPRVNSESSAKRPISYRHSRHSSVLSFVGFDSFDEVRRGFEFGNDRAPFYPPPAARRLNQSKRESLFSIASVSSYGRVINSGSNDPFDYGLPSLQERPSSERLSMMTSSIDDTFSFIRYQPRRRVESDASSFYFKAPTPLNRSDRRDEKTLSVVSQAPPVSLFNRSFGSASHRRNDSSTSASSVAQSYAMYGGTGGRVNWTKHRQDLSMDSVLSDFSAHRLGRPGIGDKMFDTAAEQGMPLPSISASPTGSVAEAQFANRTSFDFDSIIDDDCGSSLEDSLFEKMGRASEASSDSVFEYDGRVPAGALLPPNHFRPVSSLSSNISVHSPMREDDTMISMLGGGHVRRRSVEATPCPRVEKRKFQGPQAYKGFDEYRESPNKARIVEKPPNHFRPLSSLSTNISVHSPMREDDTMISMLGGGHVRRRSVEATPCPRVEKRKFQGPQAYKGFDEYRESPNKARIVEKPSIASRSSYTFGGERMISAQRGLLERQSLEDSVLVGDGEDLSRSFHFMPVFSRPGPIGRSRSSTCTTSSSGGDTPPLSSSDGFSSMSDGSQSSIDLSQLNFMLSNATHPMTTAASNRARARARGHGHRRRISQARASRAYRASVYETIEEEMSIASSPARSLASKTSTQTASQPVFIVDPETASIDSLPPGASIWDDERGIVALRKYYALRDEAQDTVTESKRQWLDTPFSVFAVQSFRPPRHPDGMQALLDHSVKSYGPLPSELRPRRVRSRTQSRPSPYPQAQARAAISKAVTPPSPHIQPIGPDAQRTPVLVLQQILVNRNNSLMSGAPSLEALKPFSPLVMDVEPKRENTFGLAPGAHPRVGSNARRTALGWTKRSTGKSSTDLKENVVGQGSVMTAGEGLRLSRPRPRGRPTPASQHRIIRI